MRNQSWSNRCVGLLRSPPSSYPHIWRKDGRVFRHYYGSNQLDLDPVRLEDDIHVYFSLSIIWGYPGRNPMAQHLSRSYFSNKRQDFCFYWLTIAFMVVVWLQWSNWPLSIVHVTSTLKIIYFFVSWIFVSEKEIYLKVFKGIFHLKYK